MSKFAGVTGTFTRIAVGDATGRLASLRFGTGRQRAAFTANDVTRASDPMLLYFTSGTTANPKLVVHTHQSYPVGHLSTLYWIGLQTGDRHWNISSPGWAKHAWSSFFAPWNAEATIFILNYARFNAKAVLERAGAAPDHHPVCTADCLANADPGAAGRLSRRAA